jgi:hypothetical protein
MVTIRIGWKASFKSAAWMSHGLRAKFEDRIVSYYTAFATMPEMCSAAGNYRPTIMPCGTVKNRIEMAIMRFLYNDTQMRRGDRRRAFPDTVRMWK